jgi:hypothetical protein
MKPCHGRLHRRIRPGPSDPRPSRADQPVISIVAIKFIGACIVVQSVSRPAAAQDIVASFRVQKLHPVTDEHVRSHSAGQGIAAGFPGQFVSEFASETVSAPLPPMKTSCSKFSIGLRCRM